MSFKASRDCDSGVRSSLRRREPDSNRQSRSLGSGRSEPYIGISHCVVPLNRGGSLERLGTLARDLEGRAFSGCCCCFRCCDADPALADGGEDPWRLPSHAPIWARAVASAWSSSAHWHDLGRPTLHLARIAERSAIWDQRCGLLLIVLAGECRIKRQTH